MTEADWLDPSRAVAELLFPLQDSVGISDRQQLLFAAACCRRVWEHLPPRSQLAVILCEADLPPGPATEERVDGLRAALDAVSGWIDDAAERFLGSLAEDEVAAHSVRWEAEAWATQAVRDLESNRGYKQWRSDNRERYWELDMFEAEVLAARAVAQLAEVHRTGTAAEAARLGVEAVARYAERIRTYGAELPNLFGDLVLDADQEAKADAAVAAARREELLAQAALLRDIVGNPFRPVEFDPRWRSETALALAAGIDAEGAFDRLPILADALEEAGCDHTDILTHCRGPGPHVRGCWVVDLLLGRE